MNWIWNNCLISPFFIKKRVKDLLRYNKQLNLFSYLLGFIDSNKEMRQFILSGSENFMLMEKISQSLAGSVAIFELLTLTYQELSTDYPVQ